MCLQGILFCFDTVYVASLTTIFRRTLGLQSSRLTSLGPGWRRSLGHPYARNCISPEDGSSLFLRKVDTNVWLTRCLYPDDTQLNVRVWTAQLRETSIYTLTVGMQRAMPLGIWALKPHGLSGCVPQITHQSCLKPKIFKTVLI